MDSIYKFVSLRISQTIVPLYQRLGACRTETNTTLWLKKHRRSLVECDVEAMIGGWGSSMAAPRWEVQAMPVVGQWASRWV